MSNNTSIFKALTDSNRLRVLKALQTKTLCACEITELLNLANSTVSQHLKVLKEAGFIEEEKDGKWINYNIVLNPDDKRVSSILSQLDFWIDDEEQIITDKKTIKQLDRNKLCKS
jgi:ArsR family transcriptional regulator